MENFSNVFRKTPFGGFNREDVVNYIEKIKNDFFEYKNNAQKTIDELTDKIRELEKKVQESINERTDNSEKECAQIDVSSSVNKINEAACHLQQTAEKICDDIGVFLDKVLQSKQDEAGVENEEETHEENNEVIIPSSGVFAQIISDTLEASEEKEAKKVSDNTEKASILDGLFASSSFTI